MKGYRTVIGIGLVVVAAVAFLIGRATPPRVAPPSPDTGGPMPGAPTEASPTKGDQAHAPSAPAAPGGDAKSAPNTPVPRSSDIASGVYHNAELKVTVEKPKGAEWAMTDNPRNFRVPEESKLLEMRRAPEGGDSRFAAIHLYALAIPEGASEASEVQKLERLDKRADPSAFKVLEEQPVDAGGQRLTRRVTLWDAKGRETKFVSVRWTMNGKLYVLMGFTEPRHFDELLPEFDRVVQSLRFR